MKFTEILEDLKKKEENINKIVIAKCGAFLIAIGNDAKLLKKNLGLELNSKTQIFKSKQGVNFCGYKINEYRLKIRDKGKRKLKKKIRYLTKEIKDGNLTSKEAKKHIAGHLGYIKIANTRNLENKLFLS